ncbi:MAG TPA: DUF2182 domain-containing protein, partial [Candidatus Acidoferrum sp.]|nr:DUF2182 domain-containing protein [Candidatus Acidoferrum sp.]
MGEETGILSSTTPSAEGVMADMKAVTEEPGAAWRWLDTKSTAAVAVPIAGLGLVGWYFTFRQAGDMSGMITGLGQVGTYMANDMAWPAFMLMWLGMMAAMMLPAIGPVLLALQVVARPRGDGTGRSVAFVAGYMGVWLLVGLVPLLAFLTFRNLPMQAPTTQWLQVAGGAALLAAGIYQFTPWKSHCFRACHSPLRFVTTHDSSNPGGALRAGVAYGLYCVGSCWALMAVLLVVGLMNLVWMAAIAIVFFAEKNWRH